jgi:hypothetical protein
VRIGIPFFFSCVFILEYADGSGWSVVLFCLNAGDNTLGGYYDSGNPTNSDIVKGLPTDVELVFWSYYHSVPERYAQKIHEHWQFAQRAPWMASGIWTWSRYVCRAA